MNAWDRICQIAVAAEELSRCDEYIGAQEANILRDACELISRTIDDNLLRQMRDAA